MMNNTNTFQNKPQGTLHKQGGGLDPLVILTLIKKNWYYLIIGLIAAYFGSRVYISHTMPVYRVSTTVLITETGESSLSSSDALLKGLGLQGGMENMDNQIRLLRSRAMTEKALKELPFEIEYYQRTLRNRLPIYPETPVKVTSENEIPLPRDTEFSITFLGNERFTLESESEYYPLHKQAVFGQEIEIMGDSLRIACLDEEWVNANMELKLYFVIHSSGNLIRSFNNRLDVNLLSGSVLEVGLSGTNRFRDVEFLNKLTEVFRSTSLERKNNEALRRIQFLDNQLVGISDSLERTETMLQQFRSRNQVMNLSSQGQAIITQLNNLERENARLSLEEDYYDYLEDYLGEDEVGSAPVVPITMGISDPGLTRLVAELADIQGQLSARGAGEMSPLQSRLIQRAQNIKEAMLETLKGLRKANSLAMADNQQQINRINRQASALPETERQLLGFERQFRLNDEIYTFLNQMKSQQQMQMASNIAGNEVIEPANALYSTIVSPNRKMVNFIALFAGTGIPFLVIYLLFLFNNKLTDEDIRRITDVPIAGNIPHSAKKINTIVFDNPGSHIVEAYRMLRSKMQFFIKDTRPPVILITSSMPGDGKTFTTINLASVYSLLGKKTIIVVFDLRKSKIFQDFNLSNKKGVSTWLIGQDTIEDIIQQTSFENLSVITSGPFPPNPSELIASEKTYELIKLLKERYDYILIDSSPIGIVSDTLHLTSLADTCLMVVRPGQTLRNLFGMALRDISESSMKGLCLVINDIKSNNNYYSYSQKYGYTSENPHEKKFWLLDGEEKKPGINNRVKKRRTHRRQSRRLPLDSRF